MNIKLTDKGQRIVLTSLLVTIWGSLFVDPLLAGLGILGAVVISYQYYQLRESLRDLLNHVEFTPNLIEASFQADEEYEETIRINSLSNINFRLFLPYGVLEPSIIHDGEQTRIFRFKPVLAANYDFSKIIAKTIDTLNILTGETELDLQAKFNVYPRVFSVTLDALRYLEGQGILGAGEQVSPVKGRGYEYAESREYAEGDDLRQIDWKATARLRRLIVKEYYTEGSGAVHIIYDRCVPDPVSADLLAAEYLRTVLSFAERGWVIGLTILDENNVVEHTPEMYPGFAVSYALRHILNQKNLDITSYYDVLEPAYNTLLRKILRENLPSPSIEFKELVSEVHASKYGGIIYITCLSSNPGGLIELGYNARLSHSRFVVLEPCTPWRNTRLENAYKIWSQYDKVNRSLMRDGVPVAVSLVEAQEKLGEMEIRNL